MKFKSIESVLPVLDVNVLSSDQQYLYKICHAVSDGQCSISLAKSSPGKLAHARWLTTANRLLRLYVATIKPSEVLQTLAEYVVKVYAPMWFQIKQKPMCQHGAIHLWKTIQLVREFSEDIQKIIHQVIATNAYFAHPENLSMITDPENPRYRELAVRRIIKARTNKQQEVRFFRVPAINFKATNYTELINWQECTVTEPPLTRDIEDAELQFMLKEKVVPVVYLEKYPCHTQAVERTVKLVTEASGKVCGAESRDGHIRARLQARANLPSFENKGQYFSAKK